MLNAKLKNKCLSKPKVHKMQFFRASASQKGLKGKNTRLKHQSEQLVREKNYKGGRGAKAPRRPLKVSLFLFLFVSRMSIIISVVGVSLKILYFVSFVT